MTDQPIEPAPGSDGQNVTEAQDEGPSGDPKPDTKTPTESNDVEAFEPDDPEAV